jgi:uncharacterized protein YkuJ
MWSKFTPVLLFFSLLYVMLSCSSNEITENPDFLVNCHPKRLYSNGIKATDYIYNDNQLVLLADYDSFGKDTTEYKTFEYRGKKICKVKYYSDRKIDKFDTFEYIGNQIHIIRQFDWRYSVLKETVRTIYTYLDDKIIADTSFSIDSVGKLVAPFYETFEYDSMGNVAKMSIFVKKDSKYELSYKQQYIFNKTNNLLHDFFEGTYNPGISDINNIVKTISFSRDGNQTEEIIHYSYDKERNTMIQDFSSGRKNETLFKCE